MNVKNAGQAVLSSFSSGRFVGTDHEKCVLIRAPVSKRNKNVSKSTSLSKINTYPKNIEKLANLLVELICVPKSSIKECLLRFYRSKKVLGTWT